MFWADTERVDLKEEAAKTYDTCRDLSKYQANLHAKIDAEKSGVSSNDIRQHMNLQLVKWMHETYPNYAQMIGIEAESEALKPKKTRVSLHDGQAGTEHPNYIMFWMSVEQLELLAASLSDSAQDQYPFMSSSTVLLEVTEEDTASPSVKELMVTLKINDEEAPTKLCGEKEKASCPLTTFASNLKSSVQLEDVVAFCGDH